MSKKILAFSKIKTSVLLPITSISKKWNKKIGFSQCSLTGEKSDPINDRKRCKSQMPSFDWNESLDNCSYRNDDTILLRKRTPINTQLVRNPSEEVKGGNGKVNLEE